MATGAPRSTTSSPRPRSEVLIEAQTAAQEGQARYEATLQDAAAALRQCRSRVPLAAQLPITFEDATVAGLAWCLHQRLLTGEVEGIEGLLPELIEMLSSHDRPLRPPPPTLGGESLYPAELSGLGGSS